MRYFKGPIATIDAVRGEVMLLLEQPNGRASEPWKQGGDYNDGVDAVVGLGEYHTSGGFGPLVEQFLSTPGVEEITEQEYRAAIPLEEFYD